jgi:glutamate-1-semialdehyde 2,1-aminomutase
MERVAPLGAVYQAGTLSGNPLAMAAGVATLTLLQVPGVYRELEAKGAQLEHGLAEAAAACEIPARVNRVGSMLTAFFVDGPVHDYASVKRADTQRYGAFFRAMLDQGVSLAPSQFEAAFVSLAHTTDDVDVTIAAARKAMTAAAKIAVNTPTRSGV